jgi:two-component system OmpR family response regulator
MHILVVEDAPHIRDFLTEGLTREGHRVDQASNIAEARAMLGESDMDVVLVDRMLPDGDGLNLIRELRRAGRETPAICLTAMDRVDECVEGLRSGVDDYVNKPFAFVELLARIEAVTRRAGHARQITIGTLEIDVDRHLVKLDGETIELTAREFSLLRALARHSGKVLSRQRLLDEVWGIRHNTRTNVVDVYVRYLRAKLGGGLIHTIRGVGYLLDPNRKR